MIAYKFLGRGARGRYSGFRWPPPHAGHPGSWVEVSGPLRPAAHGIHACRVEHLPYWMDEELWECELHEPVQDTGRVLCARRGRLLRRVDAWTADTADDLARACAERARTHAIAALRVGGAGERAAALDGTSAEDFAVAATALAAEPSPLMAAVLLDAADAVLGPLIGDPVNLVAYLATRVAGGAAGAGTISALEAASAERRWQAHWLKERLELSPASNPGVSPGSEVRREPPGSRDRV